MSIQKQKRQRSIRRALRNRNKIKASSQPRVSIFKSLQHIYAQLIDDSKHTTIASCSTLELKDLKGDKKEAARSVGLELARRALKSGVSEVVFDRGSFLYHGRVESLAEGLREGGLKV